MTARTDNDEGFSLVELMIVVLILTIIMGVIVGVLVTVQNQYTAMDSDTSVGMNTRPLIEQVAADLRSARGLGFCQSFTGTAQYTTPATRCPTISYYLGTAPGHPVNVPPGGPVVAASSTSLWFYSYDRDGTGGAATTPTSPPDLVQVCVNTAAATAGPVTGIQQAVPVLENRYYGSGTYTNASWSAPDINLAASTLVLPASCTADPAASEHLNIGYLIPSNGNYNLFAYSDTAGNPANLTNPSSIAAVSISATFKTKGATPQLASTETVQALASIAAVRYQSEQQWNEQ